MTTQVPSNPMSTQAENELICERLLAWKRCPSCGEQKWYSNYDRRDATSGPFLTCVTPSFTTWAEAGLILEAWTAANNDYDIEGTSTEQGLKISARLRQIKGISYVGDFHGHKETAPLAIRAAALDYLRKTMGWHTYLKAVKS